LRYYFNRDKREERGHSLLNNTGSFIGFQSKMVFNKNVDDVLTNDIYFGQQLPLGKHWIYRYHVGFGLGFNLAQGFGVIYPTMVVVLDIASKNFITNAQIFLIEFVHSWQNLTNPRQLLTN
jgi:hypothetical protein